MLESGAQALLSVLAIASCGRTSLELLDTERDGSRPASAASGGNDELPSAGAGIGGSVASGSGGVGRAGAANGGSSAGAAGAGVAGQGAGGAPAREWQAAVMLGHETSYGYAPEVALNEAGDALVAWRESAPSHQIWASRYVIASGSWQMASVVPFSSGFVNSVSVGIDEAGNGAAAIWDSQFELGYFDALTAEWSATIPPAPQSNNWFGRAAFVTAKSMVTRWEENPNTGGDGKAIWTAGYDSQNGWGAAQEFDVQGADAVTPGGFAASATGRAAATWSAWYVNTARVYASLKDDGETWTSPARVDEADSNLAQSPEIACNGAGDAVVVWSGGSGDVVARRYDAANDAWLPSEIIATGSAPKVCMSDNGEVIVVYQPASAASPRKIHWTHFVNGSWQGGAKLNLGPAGDASEPDCALNDSGRAVLVWAIKPPADGAVPVIWASRLE